MADKWDALIEAFANVPVGKRTNSVEVTPISTTNTSSAAGISAGISTSHATATETAAAAIPPSDTVSPSTAESHFSNDGNVSPVNQPDSGYGSENTVITSPYYYNSGEEKKVMPSEDSEPTILSLDEHDRPSASVSVTNLPITMVDVENAEAAEVMTTTHAQFEQQQQDAGEGAEHSPSQYEQAAHYAAVLATSHGFGWQSGRRIC